MSTQLNEYLVSVGAYQPRHRRPGMQKEWQQHSRRRWLERNLIRAEG